MNTLNKSLFLVALYIMVCIIISTVYLSAIRLYITVNTFYMVTITVISCVSIITIYLLRVFRNNKQKHLMEVMDKWDKENQPMYKLPDGLFYHCVSLTSIPPFPKFDK